MTDKTDHNEPEPGDEDNPEEEAPNSEGEEMDGGAPPDNADVRTSELESQNKEDKGNKGDEEESALLEDAAEPDSVPEQSRDSRPATRDLSDDEEDAPAESTRRAEAVEKTSVGGMYALAVDRPIATGMIVVAIVVFGVLSYGRLSLALMPELTYPTLTIRTDYEGAAPEEVEDEVSEPLEEALRTVEDLAGISSVSRPGTSDVMLEFQWGTSMDFVTQKVRERLDMMELPDGVDRPMVLRYDPELDPIVRLGLYGDADPIQLRRYAEDEVKRALEKVEGVAMVRVSGGEEPIIRIELQEDALAQRSITSSQVIQRLQQENINLAGGQLDDGSIEYLVRTLSEFQNLDDLKDLIVGWQGTVPVRLHEVARVDQSVKDREVVTRIGSNQSVEIEIFKEADANIVDVARGVHLAVFGTPEEGAEPPPKPKEAQGGGRRGRGPPGMGGGGPGGFYLASDLPDGVEIEVLSDRSVFIRAAINEVVDTAILGGVLAVLILFLLRSFYVTTVIGLAIPISLVVTFAALYLAGVTLNIMSLGGLALGIGMLVDNAVVVLESIYRCREEGDDPRSAAIRGAGEVGGAVVASTLTTIAVFFPIVFVEGVAGQVFGDLALAVVFSLIASLIVALFFIPMLASRAPEVTSDRASQKDENKGENKGEQSDKDGMAITASAGGSRFSAKSSEKPSAAERLRAIVGLWGDWRSLEAAKEEWRVLGARWRRTGSLGKIGLGALIGVTAVYRAVRTLTLFMLELFLVKLGGTLLAAILWLGTNMAIIFSRVLQFVLKPLLWLFGQGFEIFRAGYDKVLAGALRHRLLIVVTAVALVFLSLQLLEDVGTELIPTVHQGELVLDIALPVETALEETADRVEQVEQRLLEIDEIASTSSVVGIREGVSDSDKGPNTAEITIILEPAEDLALQEELAVDGIRNAFSELAGISWDVRRPSLFSLKTPVEIQLIGDDLVELRRASKDVLAAVSDVDGVTDVRSSLSRGYPEVHVRLDRDAMAIRGLGSREVADAVRQKVQGQSPTAFRRDDRRLDIVVRLDRAFIGDHSDLQRIVVKPRNEESPAVELESVAEISPPTEGPSEIRHIEGQRVVIVEAAPDGVDLSEAVLRIEDALSEVALPSAVDVEIAGQSAEMEVARTSLTWALLLAIFLVYIVMAARFESLAGPFVILLTIPLAGVGVVAALWMTNTPISVVVFIGVIMLAGIVVNNAIVLVDYIIQLRARGLERQEAIRQACSIRLRPVLITTLTTVFGLAPLAIGMGEGAEIRAPMAIAVMAGLASSTVLTLIVVPVVYDLIGELGSSRVGSGAPGTARLLENAGTVGTSATPSD